MTRPWCPSSGPTAWASCSPGTTHGGRPSTCGPCAGDRPRPRRSAPPWTGGAGSSRGACWPPTSADPRAALRGGEHDHRTGQLAAFTHEGQRPAVGGEHAVGAVYPGGGERAGVRDVGGESGVEVAARKRHSDGLVERERQFGCALELLQRAGVLEGERADAGAAQRRQVTADPQCRAEV